jgi:hypothetical protein
LSTTRAEGASYAVTMTRGAASPSLILDLRSATSGAVTRFV